MSVTFKNAEGLRWNKGRTGIWVKVPDDSEVYRPGDDGTLVVKDWLAEDNGWIRRKDWCLYAGELEGLCACWVENPCAKGCADRKPQGHYQGGHGGRSSSKR